MDLGHGNSLIPPFFSISDKETLLIKKTYRIITQQYYEDESQANAKLIIFLNDLICQTVYQKKDGEKLNVLSILQILKVKGKSNTKLYESALKTIEHIKSPTQKPLQFKTILNCFQQAELFSIGCTFAFLFQSKVLRSQGLDWKQLINEIGRRPSVNTEMCLELLNIICKDNQGNAKNVVKSGFVKYIVSCYLQQKIDDKYLLYKALKFLKFISNADRTVIRDREKSLARVVFAYDEYIPILEDLCGKCYDEEYCNEIYKKNKYQTAQIDLTYVWSFHQFFSKSIPQKNISQLVKLTEGHHNLGPDNQTKIYAILNNIVKYTKINQPRLLQKPPKQSKALFNYLKLISSSIENDQKSYQKLNLALLQKLVADDQNPKCQKMFKYIQSLDSRDKEHRISHISPKLLEVFSIDKNADMLMEGAGKIPKNNEDLKVIKQILKKKQANNQFQADILHSVKGKALESLSTAIIDRKKLDLNSLIKQVDLNNILVLSKMLKLIEICLMMGHYQVEDFDKNRIFQIIQWIQNNYSGQLIDWGSISQIIMIFQGQQAFFSHFNEIPNKCFWILGCIQIPDEKLDATFNKFNSLLASMDKKSYKISLILGFLGRILKKPQKTKAIEGLKPYFKILQNGIKIQQNWKISLYMESLFLSKWHQKNDAQSNQIFQAIIEPVHTHILNNFKSSEHEYKYLQACLPYKIPVQKIVDNIDFLLSEYGNLASYIYQNSSPKPNVNYDKISNISNAPHSASESILQILKFLKQNNAMAQGDEINKLLKRITQNKQKYWELYPNFVTIVNSILNIVSQTDNPSITKNLTQILVDLVNHIEGNEEITPEQADQVLQQIHKTLKTLSQKGTHLDLERLHRVTNKISNQDIKNDIKQVLNGYKIAQKPQQQQKPTKSTRNVVINAKQTQNQTTQSFKKSKQPSQLQKSKGQKQPQSANKPKQAIIENSSPDRNYMTTTQGIHQTQANDHQDNMDRQKQHLWIDDNEKNKVNIEINQLQSSQIQKNDEGKQMSLLQALKKIKRMNQKKIDTSQFSKCVEVIRNSQLKSNQKDILGHLLVQFYNIQQNPQVIDLLLEKEKTNLSKEACYEIVSKHVDAFILSDRWKFLGRQWLEIAVSRMSQGYFSYACQVIEYNLINVEDLHYFQKKKYHQNVLKNIYKVQDEEDAIFYLLLIGTSARLADIKKYYIQDKLHITILNYIDRWPQNHRIASNTFYALSSLVYIQPEICLEIAKKQSQMKKLLQSFKKNHDSRAVVESGGCFIANMAYSNDQVKQVLRKYKIVQKLVFVFGKNLQDPQISTFKQLLRSFGNLSLSQKCAKEIIDEGFCSLQVRMIQVFNMFINLDENKLKLLKIAIDVFANLCSHKYNLHVMHKQKVTVTIIMLLQTTQINIPIIMGCIDTVDGLCQNPDIQSFSVNQKKLSYILIDILKIQQDEKIIVKATRLLTNLTINQKNIPNILQANLLSVLANIVMPSFFIKYNEKTELNYLSNNPTASTPPNKKMEMYINKILVRIHHSNQQLKLILKSGYLDCLVRTIQTADNLQEVYIDILGSYAKGLPNFLNKRAFMCLIRVLTRKLKSKQTIQKCLKIFKTLLLRSYDRDEEDVVLQDSPMMYEIMLQQYKHDTLYLLGLHCSISKKLRKLLISQQKKFNIIPAIYQLSQVEEYQELANTVLFTLFNKDQAPKKQKQGQQQSQQKALKTLTEGFVCELYRIDGSCKKAKIMINEQHNIVAFKYPGGQIKKKYSISLKNLRDWQFDYQKGSRQWKLSVFTKGKGMFSSQTPAQNCATLIGGLSWGQIAYINVAFVSKEQKDKFHKSLHTLMFAMN